MPPRKPLSSRAPSSRRGGRGADRSNVQPAPSPDPQEEEPSLVDEVSYQTGSDYPAPEDEPLPDGGSQDFGPPTARYRAGEDIYGEDDPFPDDEEGGEQPARRGGPQAAIATQVGVPVVEGADDDAQDDGDDEATRAGPPIHMLVISGPDAGRKKRFRGVRMVIGRAQGCDFRLEDSSVSRRHLELVLGNDGVLLRDLGSGNGTRVNDEKVNEQRLQDGDEIAIGKTRFRFVDEAEAFRKLEAPAAEPSEEAAAPEPGSEQEAEPAPEPSATQTRIPMPRGRPLRRGAGALRRLESLGPQHKRLIAAGAGALVLLVVVLLAAGGSGPAPLPPPDPREAEVALKVQQARAALGQGRFTEAVGLLESAERILPGPDGAALLEGARKEAAAQKALDLARTLIGEAEFDRAREVLRDAPLAVVVGSAARARVENELVDAERAHRRAQVEAAVEAGDLEAAQAAFDGLPREDQLRLHPRLEALRSELDAQKAQDARRRRDQEQGRQRAQDASRRAQMDAALEGVRRRFDTGEWSRAALECDRVVEQHRGDKEMRERALTLKRLIPMFGRQLADAQKKIGTGNLEGAAAPLSKARELLRQIGFGGALGQDIDQQLARASLAAAGSASARGDWATAARHYRQALVLSPGEATAKTGLEGLYRKAEDLYLEAYIIRDRDPRGAGEKFRLVMDILPSEKATWGKARSQLAALGQ
jgi:tetratricopeptide (TPR) repeat protein